jgi:diacylglycerol kinase (ATP)
MSAPRVAVIAHAGKSLGGGLAELRRVLAEHGVQDPFWREVAKSRFAPRQVEKALERGCDLLLVWGGDGMVQRCIDAATGSKATIGIIPAGTANLLASNLGIPKEIAGAVDVALAGDRRRIDLGRLNGERFAVMAGAGFDARMIGDADGSLKEHLGRLAYVWTGAKNVRMKPFRARIDVDGSRWYDGDASCVLLGNVGKLFGGVAAFEDARPDDGLLELGVISADGALQWAETIARAVAGSASRSSHARTTKVHSVHVRFDRKVPYELDGGDRQKVRKLRIRIEPRAIAVCVPATP